MSGLNATENAGRGCGGQDYRVGQRAITDGESAVAAIRTGPLLSRLACAKLATVRLALPPTVVLPVVPRQVVFVTMTLLVVCRRCGHCPKRWWWCPAIRRIKVAGLGDGDVAGFVLIIDDLLHGPARADADDFQFDLHR